MFVFFLVILLVVASGFNNKDSNFLAYEVHNKDKIQVDTCDECLRKGGEWVILAANRIKVVRYCVKRNGQSEWLNSCDGSYIIIYNKCHDFKDPGLGDIEKLKQVGANLYPEGSFALAKDCNECSKFTLPGLKQYLFVSPGRLCLPHELAFYLEEKHSVGFDKCSSSRSKNGLVNPVKQFQVPT